MAFSYRAGMTEMTFELPSHDWLLEPCVQTVIDAVERDGDEVRIVGGAVRNTILGEPIGDIDMATTALPQDVISRGNAAGLKVIPTGIEHGTVTVLCEGRPFELTTLRSDTQTDGRHAVVAFGRDWRGDAERRDFTMNALYLDRSGKLHDPLGGLEDCLNRRVRFIGNPVDRIREDYLRIFRFFRFFATYGAHNPDAVALEAIKTEVGGVAQLSAERINKELLATLIAPNSVRAVEDLVACKALQAVVPNAVHVDAFRWFCELGTHVPEVRDPALALGVLGVRSRADAKVMTSELRLSNAMARLLETSLSVREFIGETFWSEATEYWQSLLFYYGREGALKGYAFASAQADEPLAISQVVDGLGRLQELEIPVFPVGGRDLIAHGVMPGVELGEMLDALKKYWVQTAFSKQKEDLLSKFLNRLED
ncbi:MAG: CCA tRNA nucleotidyltransferase [Rhodobacteraceae bacterium]|nr:CCA tRNA nucleotidyltransferase [Paracoccaceae bacterium]